MLSYYAKTRPEVSDVLARNQIMPGKVLEIGCGEGGFRSNFEYELEYWGVEKEVLESGENHDIKILLGSYSDVSTDIPDEYFDLVVCNDVIEHIDDYQGFLRDVGKKIRPGGDIVMSIPNVRHLENIIHLIVFRDWRYEKDGIRDRTHLRFFTKKSSLRMLSDAGLIVRHLEGINRYRPKTVLGRLLAAAGHWLFGQDTKFLQFVFLAKNENN